ncbi:azurin [Tahibacter aquaticus]|jgi:azurin|uniref:Azurin n=1 Tax=Tahibacter aquaticus TaxID=520092 RepID=A0A4V3DMF5_9GAMM|nr:azurin [Tahibacter aquaticus]TDR44140.1 azurin [Tahibacter aquaticus]
MLFRCIVVAGALLATATTHAAPPCALAIEGNDAMAFNVAELVVPAGCTQVKLTLKHSGTLAAEIMGHNWVLAESANLDALTAAAATAELADSYLPKGDARVIAHTPVIGGGEVASVTFSTAKLKKGGDYTFFCSFPGHWSMMKGKLVVN